MMSDGIPEYISGQLLHRSKIEFYHNRPDFNICQGSLTMSRDGESNLSNVFETDVPCGGVNYEVEFVG